MDDRDPDHGVPADGRHEAVPEHPLQVAAEVLEPDDPVEKQNVDHVDDERATDDGQLGGVQDVKAIKPYRCVFHVCAFEYKTIATNEGPF